MPGRPELEQPHGQVLVRRNVGVPMRDGVVLAADLYFPAAGVPDAPDPLPALIQRGAYGKAAPARVEEATRLAASGYAVVVQDVRGRFDSEGDFYPYVNDCGDGFDTAEWVRRQVWCNGRMGVFGRSYAGGAAQALALAHPRGLEAAFIVTAGSSYYQDAAYLGGAPQVLHNLGWALGHAEDEFEDVADHPVTRQVADAFRCFLSNLRAHPSRQANLLSCKTDFETFYRDWLEHPAYDAYWKQTGYASEEHYAEFPDIPVLYLGGWFDLFLRGTLRNYAALSRRGQKNPVRLCLGPWTHAGGMEESFPPQVDYGPGGAALDATALAARWFDHWLKGRDTGLLDEPPAMFFVMGGGDGRKTSDGKLSHGGEWRAEKTWPPPAVRPTPYYLHAGGALRPAKPGESRPSGYDYDPTRPVPTLGGNMTHGRDLVPVGSVRQQCAAAYGHCGDRRPLSERPDVLVFETEPLDRSLEIIGPVTARLFASSSAADTDFTAKLVDVHPATADWPEGFALNLADGVIRARYRNSFESEALLEPHRVYAFDIDLVATANVFAAGHRIRLDVSSSNFPRVAPNPNTGERVNFHTHTRVAHNRVYHDLVHPSYVLLPVVASR